MAAISLYPYQLEALKRMKNGCILCGGVGSGKSRTALAYYYCRNFSYPGIESFFNTAEYIPMDDPPLDLYIITTARKRDTFEWDGEMAPFLLSTHKENNLYSNKVVVDSWNNIKKYTDIKDAFFIFDEQRLIGHGVWVRSFYKIAKSNQWILLSATPGDTWTDYIPVFVANGFYKNQTEFIREHVVYNSFNAKFRQVERYLGTKRLERLRESILVDMDFHRPTVAHHESVFCDFDLLRYKTTVRTRWNDFENQPIVNASEYCYILRKISNTDKSRLEAVLDISKKHPRVIIFYNFDYELDLLRELDYGEDVVVAEWNGHKHEPVPDSLRWVYLVQYTAGAEGWNCIATDTIIFYSQNYSYKVMVQASGRIDRLNTPFEHLWYYHLKCRSGIDLAISRALKQKKKFNERRFAEKVYDKVRENEV